MRKLWMMFLPLALVGIGCAARENCAPHAQAEQPDSGDTLAEADIADDNVANGDAAHADKRDAGEAEASTTGDHAEKTATSAGKSELSEAQLEQIKWLKELPLAMMFHLAAKHRYLPEETGPWRITLAKAGNGYDLEQLKDKQGKTRLLLVTGPGTFFDRTHPEWGTFERGVSAGRLTDSIPLLIVVGPKGAVGVEEDRDFVFDPKDPKAGLDDADDQILVAMADGMIRLLPKSISPAAFTVLCLLEPNIDEAQIDQIDAELVRMGFCESNGDSCSESGEPALALEASGAATRPESDACDHARVTLTSQDVSVAPATRGLTIDAPGDQNR